MCYIYDTYFQCLSLSNKDIMETMHKRKICNGEETELQV